LENPGAWKPTNQDRSGGTDRRSRGSNASASQTVAGDAGHSRSTAGSVGSEEYPFPLRPGVMARLILPVDLTRDEAKRIKAFVDMLVIAGSDEEGASIKQE